MLAAVLVFLSVLLTTLAVYLMVGARLDGRARRDLETRLRAVATPAAPVASLQRGTPALSALPWLARSLDRLGGAGPYLHTQLRLAGLRYTVGTLVLASAVAALLAFVVLQLGLGIPLLALAGALLGGIGPYAYVRHARRVRLETMERLLPDALELIARGLRAGHGFVASLGLVAEEMPEPLGGMFTRLCEGQRFGVSLEDGLRELAEQVPLMDMRMLATAVLMQQESGGNLSEVLDTLAEVVRDRLKVWRQIRTLSAQGRLTGGILMALPPALAVAFTVVNPAHMALLTSDPLGRQLLAGAVVMQLAGMLLVRRIVRVEF